MSEATLPSSKLFAKFCVIYGFSYVELDGVVRISQKECEGPVPVESWGLTRISQVHMDLDNSYVYPSTAGKFFI